MKIKKKKQTKNILPKCWAQREVILQWKDRQDCGGYSQWQKTCFQSFSSPQIGFK